MMEIYEVLNQVHSEEEYMEFPEMETAACIRRVRTKLHDNRKNMYGGQLEEWYYPGELLTQTQKAC